MKKLIISILLFVALSSQVFAQEESDLLAQGIELYKDQDYLGTIQAMKKAVEDNPGSALAYYYLGISYAQIGKASSAEEAYRAVIYIDPNSALASLAEEGILKLNPEPKKEIKKRGNDLFDKVQKDVYSDSVKKDLSKRKLEHIIERVNNNQKIEHSEFNDFEDFTPGKSYNSMPTQEQIAQAYQVLARAGLNANQLQGMTPEMMQMSMMNSSFSGGNAYNQNNQMNMLPMLLMMQGQQQPNGQNVDPQLMQTMISNMMMPAMSGFYGNEQKY